MKTTSVTAMMIAGVTLSACGGSNSENDMVEDAPTAVFARTADGGTLTARGALEDGLVLTADGTETSALALDYNEDTTTFADATLTVAVNADGDLVTNLDGREVIFTDADRDGDDGFGKDLDPGFVGIFGQSEPLQEVLNDSDGYVEAVSYILADGPSTFAYAIFGARTAAADVPTGSATFEGDFKVETFPATGFESISTDRAQFRGDATINVTMDGELSGLLDDLTFRAPQEDDRVAIPGSIAMTSATITDGAFSGNLTADSELLATTDLGISDADIGTYAGRFYGPDGEEVAGTIAVAVQTEDGIENGVGFFIAD